MYKFVQKFDEPKVVFIIYLFIFRPEEYFGKWKGPKF